MRRFAPLIMALLAVSVTASAQQTLRLQSGDQLSGSFVRIDGSDWVIRFSGQEVKVPATSIAGFTSSDALGFRLTDGTLVAATVEAAAGGRFRLNGRDGSSRTVAATDVAGVGSPDNLEALVPVEIGIFKPIGDFWSALAAFGYTEKSGNSRSRAVAADFEILRKAPKDRITIRYGIAREDARTDAAGDLERTVDLMYGSLRGDIFFTPQTFFFAQTRHTRDQFQDLDLRSSYLGGFGVQIIQDDETDLRAWASGGVRYENFTSGGSETANILDVGFNFTRGLGPANFSWGVEYSPNVEEFSDYNLNSLAAVNVAVYRGLGFRLSVLNQFNNDPQPGVDKHDLLIASALTYTLGSR